MAWVGSLDGLDDDELERLLQELADAIVVDHDSLWHLAGREPPTHAEDEEVFLAYEDVDYDALREHPKLRQYLAGFGTGGGQRSRLQLILSSIAASFQPEGSDAVASRQALSALDETEAESEEELEEQAEERERRRVTLEGHLRRVFQTSSAATSVKPRRPSSRSGSASR